jgi:hypothetical protein
MTRLARRASLLVAFYVLASPAMAHAQFGVPWTRTPAVTVIGPEADPRPQLVDEAVAFWNSCLFPA